MESGNQPSVFSDLLVTHTMGNHLHDTTKWCRFISIVGIVFLFIFVIAAITAGTAIAPVVENVFPGMGIAVDNFLLIAMILFVAVFGVLTFLLLRFSILTRRGLELRSQALFNDGLKALRFYLIVYGVIGIIEIILNVAGLFSF
jgi:hypothetical protein